MLLVKQNVLKNYVRKLSAGFIASLSIPAAATTLTGPPDFLRMLMSLIIVLAVIFLLAFIVKKLKITPHSQKHLRTVAQLSVGTKERVVVVEVNGEQFMLGVTSNNVNLLHKLDQPIKKAQLSESTERMPLTIQSLLKKGKS
ncbi:flagellar biosynthetic protein FliO [Psychrobium sp. nBUS_13]|jgi:flagellar protein FliO/FliZ|uniref:flagellar biosynthetic protein FliO n=1 Tax=Psychrobium sp. nBUS_13 TaxID=3395319 RepID=UPI003EBFD488